MLLDVLRALVLGYLIGAFPSAFLVGKLKGQNIFKVGSGNMGAMNAARNLGYGLGVLVLLVDLAKGALATYLGLQLFSPNILPAFVAGVGAVIGHTWSIYIGFKGGKGLATGFGVSLLTWRINIKIVAATIKKLMMVFKNIP